MMSSRAAVTHASPALRIRLRLIDLGGTQADELPLKQPIFLHSRPSSL